MTGDKLRHEWRAHVMRVTHDQIWDDPDLVALPQDDQDRIELVFERMARELCEVVGHEPERDQCLRPEHDFCLWCHVSLPGAAGPDLRRRGAE